MNAVVEPAETKLLKLNLGAGKSRIDGYLSVDAIPFDGLDVVMDLRFPWLWADSSVSHIEMSHVLEHFKASERIHIFNEAYRVLAPQGQMHVVTPHEFSTRAYGDLTHEWPPVSEMFYYYLWKQWRKDNAPHLDSEYVGSDGFNCDFNFVVSYGMNPEIMAFNEDRRNYALKWYKDAAHDIHATLTALK